MKQKVLTGLTWLFFAWIAYWTERAIRGLEAGQNDR